jgi:uncharacterized membrane protein
MDELIGQATHALALTIEAIAVLAVSFGALEAFVRLLLLLWHPPIVFAARKAVWRRFGMWLLLGLEFELAADIIRSVISPSWADIGELAAIAVIRTFLNYFLEHDLDRAGRPEDT